MRGGGHDHHRGVLREGLHADQRLPVANREAFVRAAVLPSGESSLRLARRHQLELLDRIADLLEAIRVQLQIVVRTRQHQKRRSLEQHQLVALRQLRDRVQLLLKALRVGHQALDHIRPRLNRGDFWNVRDRGFRPRWKCRRR